MHSTSHSAWLPPCGRAPRHLLLLCNVALCQRCHFDTWLICRQRRCSTDLTSRGGLPLAACATDARAASVQHGVALPSVGPLSCGPVAPRESSSRSAWDSQCRARLHESDRRLSSCLNRCGTQCSTAWPRTAGSVAGTECQGRPPPCQAEQWITCCPSRAPRPWWCRCCPRPLRASR